MPFNPPILPVHLISLEAVLVLLISFLHGQSRSGLPVLSPDAEATRRKIDQRRRRKHTPCMCQVCQDETLLVSIDLLQGDQSFTALHLEKGKLSKVTAHLFFPHIRILGPLPSPISLQEGSTGYSSHC